MEEVLSYLMYPQVFLEYRQKYETFGDITLLDTPTFFNGIRQERHWKFKLNEEKR